MKKPFGIILATVYTSFAGIFSVVLPITGLVATAVVEPTAIERFEFILSLFIGLLALAVCCGLWNMPPWGLWLGRIYYGVSILLSCTSVVILRPKEGFFGLDALFILAEAGILLYLFQLNRSSQRTPLNCPAESLK
ncbi:MAG: hypothetical protein PVG01_08140 [Desulfobacterales bacterium]|jgi:hypothetical protein